MTPFEQLQEDGYTVLKAQYDAESIERWKQLHSRLMEENKDAEGMGSWWFGNMLERAPGEMLAPLTNPNVLELLEAMMGPFVQLDNLTLAAFAPAGDEDVPEASGWHRDRWAEVPRGDTFERPLASNAICYLNGLDEESGPLRVLAGSHRKPITLTEEQQTQPQPGERLVHAEPGDVIVTHNGLLHSGSPNRSNKPRYLFSIYYNLSWMRTTDDHSGPNVARLVADARERKDHRLLRLLGVDEQLQQRANSGFLRPDEERWAEWVAEDAAVLVR
jgi:hypothetical protein